MKKSLALLSIALFTLILAGCGTMKPQSKISTKLGDAITNTGSAIAVTLNSGKFEIYDTKTGEPIPPCSKRSKKDMKRYGACKPYKDVKIISRDKIDIVKYEGSYCASMGHGTSRIDICSPPYPKAVVDSIAGIN